MEKIEFSLETEANRFLGGSISVRILTLPLVANKKIDGEREDIPSADQTVPIA